MWFKWKDPMTGSHEELVGIERIDDVQKFRNRLWDRFLSIRAETGMNMSFEELWYDSLVRHFISQGSIDAIYEEMSKELEQPDFVHKK